MIPAEAFLDAALARGFKLYTGVPCSYLKPLINATIDEPRLRYVGAANEGDAVAIATGAALGGMPAVAMFQNSGLGNAVNPLTSLGPILEVPILLICTLRAEPGGKPDEPQHAVMGPITTRMFELMGIPWAYFPDADVDTALDAACQEMAKGKSFAFVMRDGSVAPHGLQSREPMARATEALPSARWGEPSFGRKDALAAIQRAARPDDVLIATTGYTGRALYGLGDQPNQLYMVGSMGCVASLALGLAIARPERRVIAIDGDGALLMRMGVLATVGHEQPANLVHVLLDNEAYDSTGGQATVAPGVDFANVAAACGYARVERVAALDDLEAAVAAARGPAFLHAKITRTDAGELPRPAVTPAEVARRLQGWLGTPTLT